MVNKQVYNINQMLNKNSIQSHCFADAFNLRCKYKSIYNINQRNNKKNHRNYD